MSSPAATPTLDESTDPQAVPACEKCHAPLKQATVTVCARCGWYPSLGIFVEIAHDFEAAFNTELTAEERPPAPTHLQVWARLLPWWGWTLIGTALAIVAISIGVRLASPTENFRTTWAVSQLLAGAILAFACHATAFFMAASDDSDIGILDAFIKPLRAWLRHFADLPERFWLTESACVGAVAALSAALIIGGIPYNNLLDWKIKAPPKQSLMGAVMAEAQKIEGEKKKLEDAVSDFAGQAGDGALNGDGKTKPAERKNSDCLIIGVLLTTQGGINQFVLATDVNGRLVYAGKVTAKIPPEEEPKLVAQLKAIQTPKPFVNAPEGAMWLKPQFTCQVSYTKQNAQGRLAELKFEEMRGELKLPW